MANEKKTEITCHQEITSFWGESMKSQAIALRIMLTMPITTANAKSFSKLKIINCQ